MRLIDLTGLKFTNLTVLKKSAIKKNKKVTWDCICDCGKKLNVTPGSLRSGQTKSCGCYKSKLISNLNFKHGKSYSRCHNSWHAMKQRCYYKKHKDYKNYGGIGITVCKEWLNDFMQFYNDMGDPHLNYSLDRIDNKKGYYKENCRWVNTHTQSRNKSNNVKLTFNGITMCKTDWAKKLNITQATLTERINKWGIDIALTKEKWSRFKSHNF